MEEDSTYNPELVQPTDTLQAALSQALTTKEQELYQDLQNFETNFGKIEPEF